MFAKYIALTSGLLGLSSAFAISQDDGFPSPNEDQLRQISIQANGLLSNAPPPPTLSAAGVTNFQLIAFNENFEVAFFESLLYNITNKVPGFSYESDNRSEAEVVEILKTVIAQEQLHAMTAAGALAHFNAFVPTPCTYKFPTTNLKDAIALADTFTAVVLGTLQDASQSFAANGDSGPVRAVASVIGQEGEQEGFYNYILDRKPSAQPFLTTSVAPYAFTVLQGFVEECPFDVAQIPIPIFAPLTLLTAAEPKDMYLSFSADISSLPQFDESSDFTELSLTYLSGQLLPISEPLVDPAFNAGVLTFKALFPFTENVMKGLTIATLTNASTFASPDDLPASTIAAPALIEVFDSISGAVNDSKWH